MEGEGGEFVLDEERGAVVGGEAGDDGPRLAVRVIHQEREMAGRRWRQRR